MELSTICGRYQLNFAVGCASNKALLLAGTQGCPRICTLAAVGLPPCSNPACSQAVHMCCYLLHSLPGSELPGKALGMFRKVNFHIPSCFPMQRPWALGILKYQLLTWGEEGRCVVTETSFSHPYFCALRGHLGLSLGSGALSKVFFLWQLLVEFPVWEAKSAITVDFSLRFIFLL